MADKQFIGKVEEKTFSNGGSIIKLSLGDNDKALLSDAGWTTIEIKKSQKGNWYAEINQYSGKRQEATAPLPPVPKGISDDDLPF